MKSAEEKTLELLRRKLLRAMGEAIHDYDLIREGDKIMVAVSAGKDSLTLLHLLDWLQKRSPVHFEFIAAHIDPGYGTGPKMEHYFQELGVKHAVIERPFIRMVEQKEADPTRRCNLCARFRRAALYDLATREGCSTIALGHHADDLIETLLMSILFSGQIKSMPARLISDSGEHTVIRPLCLAWEKDIIQYAKLCALPVVENIVCNQQLDTRRRWTKEFLANMQAESHHIKGNVLHSLQRVVKSHLLAFNKAEAHS